MRIAIVDYHAGNIYSVVHALKRLGVEPLLTANAADLREADGVLFPGQGNARQAMGQLREQGLDQTIRSLTRPMLGICIGQQLMCRHSEEGDVDCLNLFPVDVRRFQPTSQEFKVPHMGWNQLHFTSATDGCPSSPLFKGLKEGDYVYFVHSFYVPVCDQTLATTDYIHPFSAAMHRDNFYATQFHPEKSGDIGEHIIANFLDICR